MYTYSVLVNSNKVCSSSINVYVSSVYMSKQDEAVDSIKAIASRER